jgi:TRAP-type transport system periplasmic protein
VRTLDELRRTRMWGWDIDEVGLSVHKELGFNTVPMPIADGLRAYEENRIDGFISNPSGAVAFQWFSRTRYMLNMPLSFSWGCLMVASRAFDRLPAEHQSALRAASAKFAQRIEEVGRQQDAALLGGVFERQGLKTVTGVESLRSEFLAAARLARERLGDKLLPAATLQQVLAALADYRSEHRP